MKAAGTSALLSSKFPVPLTLGRWGALAASTAVLYHIEAIATLARRRCGNAGHGYSISCAQRRLCGEPVTLRDAQHAAFE
eukprot:6317529-Pyramimonas_sp.AAC.1